MNGTQNLNIDSKTLEQCLKTVSNFGSNTYQNICTGESSVVSWGNADWVGIIVLSLLGIGFVLVFLILMFKMIFDY